MQKTAVIAFVAAFCVACVVIFTIILVNREKNISAKVDNSELFTIHYYLGENILPFDPTDRGLGGSETAAVNLSRFLTMRGLSVRVYGRFKTVIQDLGVTYEPLNRFDIKGCPEAVDRQILIVWRLTGAAILPLVEKSGFARIILDLHDMDDPSLFHSCEKLNRVAVKSTYQESRYRGSLPVHDDRFRIAPNGVTDVTKYTDLRAVVKDSNKFIYTSCYTRGLEGLLRITWPAILKIRPDATLHVFYGMSPLVDPRFQIMMTELLEKTPNVYEYGRVSREEMRSHIGNAAFHLYPCTSFSETDCIAIKESALAGIIPIVPNFGVFRERPGVLFHGGGPFNETFFLQAGRAALMVVDRVEKNGSGEILAKMQNAIESTCISWDQVAHRWIQEIFF